MTELPEPHQNSHLVGHAEAITSFMSAAQGARLHHGWLIHGPSGIGKATLAYHIAAHILSNGAQKIGQLNPQDQTVRLIAGQAHPDLMVVSRPVDEKTGEMKAEIPVETVRELSQFFRLTSGRGGWRVAIVEDAETLNRNSANALLKILEEPPERALILITVTGIGRLLPTIRSRCRTLPLEPLGDNEMMQLLHRNFTDLEPDEIGSLIRLAEGSVGRAAAYLATDGQEIYQTLLGLLGTAPDMSVSELQAFADQFGRKNEQQSFEIASEALTDWLRRLVHLAATGDVQERMPGEGQLMRRFAARQPLESWLNVWDKVRDMLAAGAGANLDRKLVIMNSLTTISRAMA